MEELGEEIFNKVKETLMLLEEEWFQMSLEEATREQRRSAVYKGFSPLNGGGSGDFRHSMFFYYHRDKNASKYFCDKLLGDERSIKENLLKRIESSKLEVFQLTQELNIAYAEPEDLNPLEVDKYLQSKLTELHEIKEVRLKEVTLLKELDEMLCKNLGENTFPISLERVPSQGDLDALRMHIKEMEEEKRERLETYRSLRKDILHFIEKLEKPVDGELLLDVVCKAEDEVSLTKSYILDVRKLHCDLEFEMKELESHVLELWEKITSLWNLLQISIEMKESFKATVSSNTPSCIKKMKDHLNELKEMRLQNLEKFIDDLRKELEKWWERCLVSEGQRNEFLFLDSDEVTENRLEKYETEVCKWKKFYSEQLPLFEKVDYFLGLFDNMQQLKDKAKDPSRLFNTRGGALLQEEKERKRVRQELPLVQDQLVDMCLKYEEENNRPFLIDGENIYNYLEKLWKYHDIQKEKEKMERIQNKNKVLPTPKSNVAKKRVTPSKGSLKRAREGEENEALSSAKKVQRTPSKPLFKTPVKEQRPLTSGCSLPRMRTLTERNYPPLTPLGHPRNDDGGTLQASMSYDNFKADLRKKGCKEVIHSSIICSEYGEERISDRRTRLLFRRGKEEQQNDLERESYLKGTLNLASPLKKYKLPTSRRSSVVGGASGGAFLTRSRSQPSIVKNHTKGSFKSYGNTHSRKLLY